MLFVFSSVIWLFPWKFCQKNTIHCHLLVCGTYICNHINDSILQLQRRCFWKVSLNQSLCDPPDGLMLLSIWRIYSTAVKPLFHLSLGFRAPDRNNSLSGKNCFISAFVCLSWKMKNPLLMYGMKTWWKPMSAILVVWMVLFFCP